MLRFFYYAKVEGVFSPTMDAFAVTSPALIVDWPASVALPSLAFWALVASIAADLDVITNHTTLCFYVVANATTDACTSATTWVAFSVDALVG